jgi:hypothetical protein
MTTTSTRTQDPAEAQLREAVARLDDLAHHCAGATTTGWLLRHVEGEKHGLHVMPGGDTDATLLVALHTGLHSAALEAARNAVIDAEAALADQAADGWPGAEEDPAYLAHCAEQEARGDLAGCPETIGCYECGGFDGHTAPERTVVALGPVVDRADPTQTYRLACGHTAI